MPFVCAHKHFLHFFFKSLNFLISVKKREKTEGILAVKRDNLSKQERERRKKKEEGREEERKRKKEEGKGKEETSSVPSPSHEFLIINS